MKNVLFLTLFALTSFACKSGGGSNNNNTPQTNQTQTQTPLTPQQKSSQDIVGAIERNCVSCHNATGEGRALNFTTAGVIQANSAKISASIENGTMPKGKTLSTTDRQIFDTWKSLGYPAPSRAAVAPAVTPGVTTGDGFDPIDCDDGRRRGKGKARGVDVEELLEGILGDQATTTTTLPSCDDNK